VTGYTLNSVKPCDDQAVSVINSTSSSPPKSDDLPQLMGKNTVTVTGTSIATANMPLMPIPLLLDNSPSMGAGATPADATKMVNNTATSAPLPATTTTPTTTTSWQRRSASPRESTCCAPPPAADGHRLGHADYSSQFRMATTTSAPRETTAARAVFAVVQPVERRVGRGNIV
jgi:hypothetical protein